MYYRIAFDKNSSLLARESKLDIKRLHIEHQANRAVFKDLESTVSWVKRVKIFTLKFLLQISKLAFFDFLSFKLNFNVTAEKRLSKREGASQNITQDKTLTPRG